MTYLPTGHGWKLELRKRRSKANRSSAKRQRSQHVLRLQPLELRQMLSVSPGVQYDFHKSHEHAEHGYVTPWPFDTSHRHSRQRRLSDSCDVRTRVRRESLARKTGK